MSNDNKHIKQHFKLRYQAIDCLKRYLKIEKLLVMACCIGYVIVILIIGHIFNRRFLEEHCQLVRNTVSKEFENEGSSWENYLVFASMMMSDGEALKIFEQDVSSAEIVELSYKFGKYKLLLPHTYDIYLYNVDEGIIFSTLGMKRGLEEDELVKEEFREQIGKGEYSYKKNFLIYDDSDQVKAIAHVMYLNRQKSLFLIILEDYQLYKAEYEYCEQTTGAEIIITMKDGLVICGTQEYPAGSHIDGARLFQDRNTSNPYEIMKIGDKKCVVTYVETQDRVAISIKPYSQIISNNPFDSKWIPLYLILGILVAQILAMEGWLRIYIGKLREKLTENKVKDAEKLYLLEYLDNPTMKLPRRVKEFCDEKFGCDRRLGFIIFRIDSYKDMVANYSAEDVNHYRFALTNMFEEIFEEKAVLMKLRRNEWETLYIYSLHEDAGSDSLFQTAESCRKCIHGYVNFDTSYFISGAVEPEKILEKYSEAMSLS